MSLSKIDLRSSLLSENSFITTSQSSHKNENANTNEINLNKIIMSTSPPSQENINDSKEFLPQKLSDFEDGTISPNRRHKLFNSTAMDETKKGLESLEEIENAKNTITFGEDILSTTSQIIGDNSGTDKFVKNDQVTSPFNNDVLQSLAITNIWKNNDQQNLGNFHDNINQTTASTTNSFNLFQNDPKNLESLIMIQKYMAQNPKSNINISPKKHHSLPTPDLFYDNPAPMISRSAKSFDYNSTSDLSDKTNFLEMLLQSSGQKNQMANSEMNWPPLSQHAQNTINENAFQNWNNMNGDTAISTNNLTQENAYNFSSQLPNINNPSMNNFYGNINSQVSHGQGYGAPTTLYHINFPKQPHHLNQNQQNTAFNPSHNYPQARNNASNVFPKSNLSYPHPKHAPQFQYQGLSTMRPIIGAHPGKRGSHNIFGSYSHQSITNFPKVSIPNQETTKSGINLDKTSLLLALNANKSGSPIMNPPSRSSLQNFKQRYEDALRQQQQQQQTHNHQLFGSNDKYLDIHNNTDQQQHFDFQSNMGDITNNISPFEKDGQPISPLLLAATKERFERQRLSSGSGGGMGIIHDLKCKTLGGGGSKMDPLNTHSTSLPHQVCNNNNGNATNALNNIHQHNHHIQLHHGSPTLAKNQGSPELKSLQTHQLGTRHKMNQGTDFSSLLNVNEMAGLLMSEDPSQNLINMNTLEEQILSIIGNNNITGTAVSSNITNNIDVNHDVTNDEEKYMTQSLIGNVLAAAIANHQKSPFYIGNNMKESPSGISGKLSSATTFPGFFPNDSGLQAASSDSGLDLDSSNATFSPPFILSPTAPGPLIRQQHQQQMLRQHGGLSSTTDDATSGHMFQQHQLFGGGGPCTPVPEYVEKFSRKVFVGGLPPDIDEEEITNSFRGFGYLVVDWPHKAESKSYFPPKGYAFLLFQEESSVQSLMDACYTENGKHYLYVSSPTIKDKPVQIRAWNLGDADFVLDASQPLDPRKTIFVGGVPRPLRAVELALIMDRLYGNVCYAGIDTDPELKYPKGAGRVAFSTKQSYIAAISARFVQLQHGDIDKRVEVKPYVLDDQSCDECNGMRCMGKYAPFFCANVSCLKYYCELCWASVHTRPGKEFHKPLVKEGGDRPRTLPFRLY